MFWKKVQSILNKNSFIIAHSWKKKQKRTNLQNEKWKLILQIYKNNLKRKQNKKATLFFPICKLQLSDVSWYPPFDFEDLKLGFKVGLKTVSTQKFPEW